MESQPQNPEFRINPEKLSTHEHSITNERVGWKNLSRGSQFGVTILAE